MVVREKEVDWSGKLDKDLFVLYNVKNISSADMVDKHL